MSQTVRRLSQQITSLKYWRLRHFALMHIQAKPELHTILLVPSTSEFMLIKGACVPFMSLQNTSCDCVNQHFLERRLRGRLYDRCAVGYSFAAYSHQM